MGGDWKRVSCYGDRIFYTPTRMSIEVIERRDFKASISGKTTVSLDAWIVDIFAFTAI